MSFTIKYITHLNIAFIDLFKIYYLYKLGRDSMIKCVNNNNTRLLLFHLKVLFILTMVHVSHFILSKLLLIIAKVHLMLAMVHLILPFAHLIFENCLSDTEAKRKMYLY